MLDKARPAVKPILEKLARPFIRIHPNWLSLAGPIVALIYFWLMKEGYYWAALVSLAGIGFDFLDGTVARMTGKESKFGAFWDATLDRLADFLILAAFGVSGLIPWPWVMVAMLASFLISYTRAKAGEVSGGKVRLAVGIAERPERMILISLMTLAAAVGWYGTVNILFGILILISLITIIQRILAAKRSLA